MYSLLRIAACKASRLMNETTQLLNIDYSEYYHLLALPRVFTCQVCLSLARTHAVGGTRLTLEVEVGMSSIN